MRCFVRSCRGGVRRRSTKYNTNGLSSGNFVLAVSCCYKSRISLPSAVRKPTATEYVPRKDSLGPMCIADHPLPFLTKMLGQVYGHGCERIRSVGGLLFARRRWGVGGDIFRCATSPAAQEKRITLAILVAVRLRFVLLLSPRNTGAARLHRARALAWPLAMGEEEKMI
jgi:hypothetical protein